MYIMTQLEKKEKGKRTMVLNVPSSNWLLFSSSNVIPNTDNFSFMNCSPEWFICVMLSEALSGSPGGFSQPSAA